MSFNEREISNQEGQPVALYRFQWGNTFWFYTSADRPITRTEIVSGAPTEVEYQPLAISDNGMVQGGEQSNDFTINAPNNIPLAVLYRGTPPSGTIYLIVRRKHHGDDDAPVWWIGTVGNVKRPDDVAVNIIGRTLTSTFQRSGLRLSWQRSCPFILYDGNCKADPELFGVAGTVTAKDGVSITVTGGTVGEESKYRGGFIKWEADVNGTMERRGIEQIGDIGSGVFQLFGRPDRLEIGTEIMLYPGCAHTPTACDTDFDNLANYGGYDFMPGKSPFDGTPVF